MIHAAILCRVSTEAQRDNTSLADQRRILIDLCDRAGWTHEVFDEVESGGVGIANRPVLAQILGRITAGEFQRLAVLVPDRLSRAGVGELEEIGAILAKVGARLVTQAGESDPRNIDHVLVADVQAVIAKNERLRTRERTIRGREAVAKAGKFTGHMIPFGWVRVWLPDGSTVIEIDPGAAAVIRRIYEAFAVGTTGGNVIAGQLNAEGITLHGRPWSAVTVRRILASHLYQGIQEWRSRRRKHATDLPRLVVPSSAFPAIVSPELWAACAAVRGDRAGKPKPPSAGDWPLTGILHCRECGGSMAVSGTGTKIAGGPYYYYRCGPCRGGVMIRADVAHRVVFEAVPKAWAWAANTPASGPDPEHGPDVAELRAKLLRCDADEADLWAQKRAGMDPDQWKRFNARLLDDRGQIEAAIAAAERSRVRSIRPELPVGDLVLDPSVLEDRAALRELFVHTFQRLILYPHGSSKRRGLVGPLREWRVGRATLVDGGVWR